MNANENCIAYAGHLKAEHRELHQRLRALQAELNQVAFPRIDEPLLARMIERGQRLADEIAAHFCEELDGGCLDYAVSRVPGLAAEARTLEAEHSALLAELDSMLKELRAARPEQLELAQIKRRFDAFVVRLLSHESRENRVVERGFNMPLD